MRGLLPAGALLVTALLSSIVCGCVDRASDEDLDERAGVRSPAAPGASDGAAPPDADGFESETLIRFAQELLRDAAVASDLEGLGTAVRDREFEYSQRWFRRLMPQRVLDELQSTASGFRCVAGVGPRGDDAVLYGGTVGETRVELIDSRVLVLAVTPTPAVDGVEPVFERFVDYGGRRAGVTVSRQAERVRGTGSERGGTIDVDRGDAPGWFARPIAWATEPGGRHVFVMVKQVVIPSTKVPWSPARAPLFVDGIPTGDPRTYRRFVDSNREGLSRERFREIVRLQARRDAVPTGAPKGVPIGVDRER